MAKVSVLMSVYNCVEAEMREAIESVLNQTFSDFEFVIVNDGSTDNTPQILAEYANRDSRIKIVEGNHTGFSNALNLGMKNCTGEYIARMDGDDISHPDRLKKQTEFLDNNPDVSILGASIETFPKKKVISYPLSVGFVDMLQGCPLAHPLVIFRRAVFERYNLLYDANFACEDYELWSRAVRHLNIANLPDVLLNYRVKKDSLSHTKLGKIYKDSKIVKQRILDILTKDAEKQKKLLKYFENKKSNIFEKLFSYRNKWYGDEQYKVLTILGIRIKLYKKV